MGNLLQRRFTFYLSVLVILLSVLPGCRADFVEIDSDPNPVLLISIDGFMPEYMTRVDTPNLDRIAANGVKAESMMVAFPTKTFPTHYSIVTGLYVENHGIIANSFYDYELEAYFSYGPPVSGSDDDAWWGGEPIWVTVEKQSKTAATMFWPGSDSQIRGIRPTRYVDYDGSVSNHARIDSVINWLNPAGEVKADFSTLYFSKVDNYGHNHGPNSSELEKVVQEADGWMGYLLDRMDEARLTDKLNLIIVSDHGMTELSEEKVIFLDELINLDVVDMIDWTPVAMIRPDEGHTDEIYQTLKKMENHYQVYLKNDLPEYYHFRNHYRIPEIIMIADLGYTITTRNYFEERGLMAANHGYDHRLAEMHAIFMAKGPDFQQGLVTDTVSSIHLYELIASILGVEPAPNDGSLDELRYLLRN
jgi:predicted AlkP superfamily pyrophosphatase or phosphodiesterase